MPGLLPPAGTVYLRRLVELLVDGGERREVENRAEANRLPHLGGDEDGSEPIGLLDERNGLAS